ncbi:hypothetical protein QQA45_05550 [Sneathia sanguinegens]|uniref:Outer membrane protein n=1 Tax=Sneathia sanguinegens TaxID=40543 RepID=A0ABT7HKA5_9FUSO|nr:hypothetical protein [Sneathia sanguinegens]MDK9580963.1 hypothetical protein [Sneathia sanguinegens]
MKKLLLAIFAVTSVGFAADRVVTITPSVEASGMLRPNKNNTFVEIADIAKTGTTEAKPASSFYVTPTVGLSVEARTKIEKAKLLDKLSVEAGGGLKQDILLVNATNKNIFGSTYAYGLTEVNYAIKHDLKAYAQARLGLGATYSIADENNKFCKEFEADKVELSAMADLGAGLSYKNVKAGLVLGVKGPIAKEKGDKTDKKLCLPEFTFGVKVGYDIPVKF